MERFTNFLTDEVLLKQAGNPGVLCILAVCIALVPAWSATGLGGRRLCKFCLRGA